MRCGWLVDRFGLSWQIIPSILPELLADPDREKAQRVLNAMLGMRKIDIAALERAAAGEVALRESAGRALGYALEHMLQHVVNHSSYHRGQVVTLLRQRGQCPSATDFLVFFDEGADQSSYRTAAPRARLETPEPNPS